MWADLGGEKSARSGLRSFSPVTPEKTALLMPSSPKAHYSILRKDALRATIQIMLQEMYLKLYMNTTRSETEQGWLRTIRQPYTPTMNLIR